MKKMQNTASPFKCPNEKLIPDVLLCAGCKEYVIAEKKEYSPVSILYCPMKRHQNPELKQVVRHLKELIPDLDPTLLESEDI